MIWRPPHLRICVDMYGLVLHPRIKSKTWRPPHLRMCKSTTTALSSPSQSALFLPWTMLSADMWNSPANNADLWIARSNPFEAMLVALQSTLYTRQSRTRWVRVLILVLLGGLQACWVWQDIAYFTDDWHQSKFNGKVIMLTGEMEQTCKRNISCASLGSSMFDIQL